MLFGRWAGIDFQGLDETTTNSGRAPLKAPCCQENDTQ
ncbi:UNVERIFIED_ORG: hypothetical protein GGE64_005964 [Rhizobium etli]